MSTNTHNVDYPTEYRGNTIYDECKVRGLQPDNKPNLSLVQNDHEIDYILDSLGIDYDRESIVLEDSYNCLWVDTDNGEYVEVWGIHKNVPYLGCTAVRLK